MDLLLSLASGDHHLLTSVETARAVDHLEVVHLHLDYPLYRRQVVAFHHPDSASLLHRHYREFTAVDRRCRVDPTYLRPVLHLLRVWRRLVCPDHLVVQPPCHRLHISTPHFSLLRVFLRQEVPLMGLLR